METKKLSNVDEYISSFPPDVQKLLELVRQTIRKAAPQAKELISYAMPAYKTHGILVYFAAFKDHIGFYALPSGNAAFRDALSAYKMGRGSIQFPLNKPLPLDLITDIVKFRVEEDALKSKKRGQ